MDQHHTVATTLQHSQHTFDAQATIQNDPPTTFLVCEPKFRNQGPSIAVPCVHPIGSYARESAGDDTIRPRRDF